MDTIFRYFLKQKDPDKRRVPYSYWFVDTFPEQEFAGEELIFFNFIRFCTKLDSEVCSKYLDVYMSTELRKLLIAKKIRVPGTESLLYDDPSALETAVCVTETVMRDDYKALEMMETNLDDFIVDVTAYMSKKHGERVVSILTESFNLLQDKDDSEKAAEYAQQQLSLIQDVYDVARVDELVEKPTDKLKMFKITDFGIPAVDNDSGGIWSTQLIGIEAQPGTGKTRFAMHLIYNAAVLSKRNALFISLEQSKEELEAMLVAKHVFNMFNILMDDSMILHGNVPKEYEAQVAAARIDLFESGKYGKIVLESTDFEVETFISKLKTFDKLKGPFDLIAIDYIGIIGSVAQDYKKDKDLYEIVKSAMRQYKRYVRRTNKAGIAISQFNKEGIEAGQNDKDITTFMAEGGIAVYKNTDYNIAMSMTATMKLQGKRRLSQPKVRGTKGFGSIIVDTRLGFCYFKQQEQKEV